MIKVFQIPSNKLEEIYPQSPFMYSKGETKFFDLLANVKHYEHVADIAGDDLNKAFEYGNIGPEVFIKRYGQMHSVSVGDILVTDSGSTYVVAKFGFDEIEIKLTERVA